MEQRKAKDGKTETLITCQNTWKKHWKKCINATGDFTICDDCKKKK